MSANSSPGSTLSAEIHGIIEERLGYGHFFVQPPASISLEHVSAEELTWEIYHGRLLDAAQTRRRQTFESWNLYWIEGDTRSGEPLLSVKFDAAKNCLHVTRGIECYAWEAYDDGANNVILTREVRKWTRELVATLELAAYSNLDHLREDLGFRLFQAVIGTSRLPLTSLEAPLPGFTLGKLAYFANWKESGTWTQNAFGIIERAWYAPPWQLEEVKTLEIVLRTAQSSWMNILTGKFIKRWQGLGHALSDIPALILRVFDEVALSPYTNFIHQLLTLVGNLQEVGALNVASRVDILCAILSRLGRHLTAFDLVKFHHRGANYPDLLMLDAVLKELLALAARETDLLEDLGRACVLRRLALRQGYCFRRRYEGHLVPDVPTSHGENMRVLPPSFHHVSEEQILDPSYRTRRLFEDDPIASHIPPSVRLWLHVGIGTEELRELGTAIFLDRPLGVFKHPTEPDQTLLLSYVAFSRIVAERRLREMCDMRLICEVDVSLLGKNLAAFQVEGIPIPRRSIPNRPGVPSLEDAFKVAPDFVLLRTTRRTVNDFLTQYDLNDVRHRFPLELLPENNRVVILGGAVAHNPASLMIYTPSLRLEFTFDPKAGYAVHRCHEYPASGLQLVRVWQPDETGAMVERDVRAENIRIGPRG